MIEKIYVLKELTQKVQETDVSFTINFSAMDLLVVTMFFMITTLTCLINGQVLKSTYANEIKHCILLI